MKRLALICALAPGTLSALTLELPRPVDPLAQTSSAGDSVFLPTGPFLDGEIAGLSPEGAVTRQSWRLADGAGLTTMQILQPLRAQLEAAGFETIFECEADRCGGFDFRYRLDVLPEPEMHVNFGDYRYLAARRTVRGTQEFASLVVSRSAKAGFVQLTRVGAALQAAISTSTKAPPLITADAGPIGAQLEAAGRATLDDLVFTRGKAQLGDEAFASLQSLADYLGRRPDRTVVLVGHTDSEGSLPGNIALSKRRAKSVVDRLVKKHGVDRRQVSADGVGFLSPRASNLTQEGRALNRRVEVVLSSTE